MRTYGSEVVFFRTFEWDTDVLAFGGPAMDIFSLNRSRPRLFFSSRALQKQEGLLIAEF
jgi:hypothetical protein